MKLTIRYGLERQRRTAFGPTYRRSLSITPERGLVEVEDYHRDFNGTPLWVKNGRTYAYAAQGLTKKQVASLLVRIRPLIERLIAGHSVEYSSPTGNFVGVLTDDATTADLEIAAAIDEARGAW
jgi:hypothetical protein